MVCMVDFEFMFMLLETRRKKEVLYLGEHMCVMLIIYSVAKRGKVAIVSVHRKKCSGGS